LVVTRANQRGERGDHNPSTGVRGMPGPNNPKPQGNPQQGQTERRSDSPSPGRDRDDADRGPERGTQKPGQGMSSGQRQSDESGPNRNDDDERGMDPKENDSNRQRSSGNQPTKTPR
jgi:hypothetical protein